MKQIIISAFLMVSSAATFGQTQRYEIIGSLKNVKDKAKAYLRYSIDGLHPIIDSANIEHGAFAFILPLSEILKVDIIISHNDESLRSLKRTGLLDQTNIYVIPGKTYVVGLDSIYDAKVSGQLNKDYREMQTALKPLKEQNRELQLLNRKVHVIDATEKMKVDYQMASRAYTDKQYEILKRFINSHPGSLVSLEALQRIAGGFPQVTEIEPLYNALSNKVKKTKVGLKILDLINKLKVAAIGSQAPLFILNDDKGKLLSLKSLRGKFVLIDFWASWCVPCRAENVNVVKAYNLFKEKNFTVLGVSLDSPSGKNSWLKAISDDGLEWYQVADLEHPTNKAAELYGVLSIPQNFLIDPQGKIIAKDLKGDNLIKTLKEVTQGSNSLK